MTDNKSDVTYVLELTPEQSRAIQRACEFYARMKFGQFQEITWQLMNFRDDDFCERRDKAEELLFDARKYIYPELESRGHSYGVGRDYEADSAWEVYEALRYIMAWHEHPNGGITVDFDKPMRFAGAGVPKCYVKKDDRDDTQNLDSGEWIKSDRELSVLNRSTLSEERKKSFRERHSYYECSQCGNSIWGATDMDKPKYCWECGCKMRNWRYQYGAEV